MKVQKIFFSRKTKILQVYKNLATNVIRITSNVGNLVKVPLYVYRSVDFSPLFNNRIKVIRPYFGIYVSFSVSFPFSWEILWGDKNQDATFANVLLFEDFYSLEHSVGKGRRGSTLEMGANILLKLLLLLLENLLLTTSEEGRTAGAGGFLICIWVWTRAAL